MRHTLFIIGLTVLLSSCFMSDDATTEIALQVQVALPDGFQSGNTARTVTLTSANGRTYTALTDSTGCAHFSAIVPDVYAVNSTWEVSAAEYATTTQQPLQIGKVYTVTGSLLGQTLTAASTISLATTVAEQAAILISKVYYAGSKDANNKNYLAGRYIELYNNSDQAVDVAGIYVGLVESESTPAYSLGTTPDHVYLKQIFQIPANESKVLQPGATLLIANSAIDHSSINSYERNLSQADFEAKYTEYTNNPDVTALTLVYTAYAKLTYMNLVQGAPASLVLFSTTDNIAEAWPLVYASGKSSGTKFYKTPISAITDGVEILKYNATAIDTNNKRLYNTIDAGYTHINAVSGYTGEVVVRKVSGTTAGGRIILSDTNNSTQDFTVATTLGIGQYQ